MPDQRAFAASLLDPGRAVPDGLVRPDGGPATRRFDVYRNNVVQSLCEALAEAFPAVRKLVGAEFFAAMAGVFVRAHPPRSPLMMLYGEDFPGFLAAFPPVAHLPYLPDTARLEQARREAYHAADDPLLDPAALARLPEAALQGARLRLHASVRVIASPHPVLSIWRANMSGGARPEARPETVLVSRPAGDVLLTELPGGAGPFVEALRHMTLGAAAPLAPDLPATLTALLGAGALAAIETEEDRP